MLNFAELRRGLLFVYFACVDGPLQLVIAVVLTSLNHRLSSLWQKHSLRKTVFSMPPALACTVVYFVAFLLGEVGKHVQKCVL